MGKKLRGVLPVLQTPFLENGNIDYSVLEKEINWAYQCGADGIGTGMVSEILRLTKEERLEYTSKIGALNQARGAYFCSVGAETTADALDFAKCAFDSGADGLMAIPPAALPLDEKNLLNYYKALATLVELPLIVQDASGYVGKPIPMGVYLELLRDFGPEKIQFKPEAPPLGSNLSALRDATKGQARIFEGSGGISLVDSYRRGIVGTIPGMDLLEGVVALWSALETGNDQLVYSLFFPICGIVSMEMQAGLDGFLAIEKYFLRRKGIFKNEIRRAPIHWTLDKESAIELDRLYVFLEKAIGGTTPGA